MSDDPQQVKIDELAARIRKAEGKKVVTDKVGNSRPVKMSRVGFDFMGSVLGGTLLGVLIDKYIPQLAPWALIVMICVGFIGGMMTVWRAISAPDQG